MARDTFFSNQKTYLSWEVKQLYLFWALFVLYKVQLDNNSVTISFWGLFGGFTSTNELGKRWI